MNRSHPPFPAGARGAALIVTLSVLVLVTVLLVGLCATLRLERGAAASHFERTRAELFAGYGVEEVIATLQTETVDPDRYWISQPGRIVAGNPGTERRLHSGAATQADAAELNVRTLLDSGYLVSGKAESASGEPISMPVNWIYLFEEEDVPPGPDPSAGTVVGRYAYWSDDESAKINFNLAWSRSAANPNPYSHPSRVNLAAVLAPALSSYERAEELARAVHFFRATPAPPDPIPDAALYGSVRRTFFDTREDVFRIGAADAGLAAELRDAFEAARFEVTHYNSEPDVTFFNEPRIVLTTRAAKAGGRPFLDILTSANADPGVLTSLNKNKLTATVQRLISYLKRTDWPMAPGSSFQQKYYGDSEERLTQLAVNIIDYVRSAESERRIVEPIRGTVDESGAFSVNPTGSADNTYLGVTRAPMITEMAFWMSDETETRATEQGEKALYPCKFFIEIYLPEHYGLDEIPLVGDVEPTVAGDQLWGIYNYESRNAGTVYYDGGGRRLNSTPGETPNRGGIVLGAIEGGVLPYVLGGKTTLKAGEYATIVHDVYRELSYTKRSSIYLKAQLRLGEETQDGFHHPSAIRISSAPNASPGGAAAVPGIVYTIGAPPIAPEAITSVQCDDPRVNIVAQDWTRYGQPANTLAGFHTTGENSVSRVGKAPESGITPQQDTDAQGRISRASLRMPAPRNTPGNPRGQVESAGELGFIHTGIEHRNSDAGVPWRTLRLQPTAGADGTQVPDWAFMDLFSAPMAIPESGAHLYAPFKTGRGGRVNLNIRAVPFADLERVRPLIAILQGSREDTDDPEAVVSAEEALEIARNIDTRKLADDGVAYGYPDGYDSPGEVVEIAGVADGGEASEERVRQISDLITIRSNVFTVYTIGQAMRQSPDGKRVVTGEQRQQVMIERYRPDPAKAELRFRTLYVRNLNP